MDLWTPNRKTIEPVPVCPRCGKPRHRQRIAERGDHRRYLPGWLHGVCCCCGDELPVYISHSSSVFTPSNRITKIKAGEVLWTTSLPQGVNGTGLRWMEWSPHGIYVAMTPPSGWSILRLNDSTGAIELNVTVGDFFSHGNFNDFGMAVDADHIYTIGSDRLTHKYDPDISLVLSRTQPGPPSFTSEGWMSTFSQGLSQTLRRLAVRDGYLWTHHTFIVSVGALVLQRHNTTDLVWHDRLQAYYPFFVNSVWGAKGSGICLSTNTNFWMEGSVESGIQFQPPGTPTIGWSTSTASTTAPSWIIECAQGQNIVYATRHNHNIGFVVRFDGQQVDPNQPSAHVRANPTAIYDVNTMLGVTDFKITRLRYADSGVWFYGHTNVVASSTRTFIGRFNPNTSELIWSLELLSDYQFAGTFMVLGQLGQGIDTTI